MIFYMIRKVAPKFINLEQRHEGHAEFPRAPLFFSKFLKFLNITK